MAESILYTQLIKKNSDEFDIIDIRDEDAFACGHIPGAINIPLSKIDENLQNLNKKREYYICCRNGVTSVEVAENLCEKGIRAFSLKGGYVEYLKTHLRDQEDNKLQKQVEHSLQKTFRKELLTPFIKAIKIYNLIEPNDRIAVCISGGKDSFLMAKLFQELQKFTEIPFELKFLVMDPGYSKENREIIEKNAKLLGIPITVFETNIFESVFNVQKSPCYLCARMRRGYLYNEAKKLGCNKIALGHHYDDVIETILMGMLYGAQVQTMMPKLESTNFEGMELIRPMYLIREADIIRFRDYNGLHFLQCACKFTANCSSEGCDIQNTGSKRKKVKTLIATLKKDDPQIEGNIFKSVENVNLSTIIAYKDKDGVKHSFLDDYKEKKDS